MHITDRNFYKPKIDISILPDNKLYQLNDWNYINIKIQKILSDFIINPNLGVYVLHFNTTTKVVNFIGNKETIIFNN